MTYANGNPLIDAETTLVGWTNRSAIRNSERTYLAGDEVLLNTKLDAASRFSLVVSHPGVTSSSTLLTWRMWTCRRSALPRHSSPPRPRRGCTWA